MDTLVLSKTWEAYDRMTWEEAFKHMCGAEDGSKKVEVIEYYNDRVVHSGSNDVLKEWKVPSVIRFIDAVTPEIKVVRFSRENIYSRDRGRCQYCGIHVKMSEFEYEHVIPRSRGGKTVWENIVVACTGCNQRKGNKTPNEAGMRLLTIPRRPEKSAGKRRMTIEWKAGMPEAWKNYMRSVTYWHGELENENELSGP